MKILLIEFLEKLIEILDKKRDPLKRYKKRIVNTGIGDPIIEPCEPCFIESTSCGVEESLLHRPHPEHGGKLLVYFSPVGWKVAHEDGSVEWSTVKRWFK